MLGTLAICARRITHLGTAFEGLEGQGLQSLRRRRTTWPSTSCSWWVTSERRCRSEASPQPTRRPPARSRRSRPLCRGRAYVTVTLPYGAARSSHRLPLLEAAGGGFLASPASRGVGLPSRHLEGSGRPVWGRSEGAQPPPAREFVAQPPSSPSPDRPRVLLERRFRALGRRVIVLVAASRRADARRSRAERVARARRPSGPFAARQGLKRRHVHRDRSPPCSDAARRATHARAVRPPS